MPVPLLDAASTVGAHTLTVDRLVATTAVAIALAGTVLGALAVARRTGRGGNRRATVALAAGSIGVVVGGLVIVTADGGPGTGNGVVGGYAALALGLIAALLGGLATVRSRREAGVRAAGRS
jgi:hypothetical protein